MEPKKNPKADLNNRSMLFFQLGMILMLFVAWQAIEWKTYEVTEKKCPGFEYFMEIFLIIDFMNDLQEDEFPTLDKKGQRLIHYAEFDA